MVLNVETASEIGFYHFHVVYKILNISDYI